MVQLPLGVYTRAAARLPHEVQGEQGQASALRGTKPGCRSRVHVRRERRPYLFARLAGVARAHGRRHRHHRRPQEGVNRPSDSHRRAVRRDSRWQGLRRSRVGVQVRHGWPGLPGGYAGHDHRRHDVDGKVLPHASH